MSRFVTTVVLTLAVPLTAIAAEPGLKAFEEQLQEVIDSAAPSVVSVVVSHNKQHKPPLNAKPGELGDVDPNDLIRIEQFRLRGFRPQVEVTHPLDLRAAEHVSDYLYGSGVVLDATAGLILTPYHLIDGARKIYVRGSDGKGSYANIHAADAKSDLAVLRLITPIRGMKTAKIAEVRLAAGANGEKPNLKKGSLVIALGHPTAAAVGSGSAASGWGMVCNIGQRSAEAPQEGVPPIGPSPPKPFHQYGGLIQLDARVSLGATGAAVFNADGKLVGMGSSVAAVFGSEVNGGYAVPMDLSYRRVIEVLKEGKEVEYGFLGVSPETIPGGGVLISRVTVGCPALQAGIMEGDVLTSVDGHQLNNTEDLLHHVGGALAGSEVELTYLRGGRTATTKLTLAKNLNTMPFIASVQPPTPFGISVDYFSTKFAGGGLFDRNAPNPPPGVLVKGLEAGSAGERAIKAAGQPKGGEWLITHVDGDPISTPKEFYRLTDGKRSVKVHLADPSDPLSRQVISIP